MKIVEFIMRSESSMLGYAMLENGTVAFCCNVNDLKACAEILGYELAF